MNSFLLSPSERLRSWKALRGRLVDLAQEARLQAVAQYWSHAPLSTRALDLVDCTRWPSPWEMLAHNKWCRSSLALGMENTLRLAGTGEQLRLRLLRDQIHDALLVVIIDDIYGLNYDWGSVTRLPFQPHQVVREWLFAGRDYRLIL